MFENVDNLGQRIKIIRLKKGDTLKEFGERLDPQASHSLVSRWERNINKPNRKRLEQIAEIGQVSLDYLVTGTKTFSEMTEEEKINALEIKGNDLFRSLNESFKNAVSSSQKQFENKTKERLLKTISRQLEINEVYLFHHVLDYINLSEQDEIEVLASLIAQLNWYIDLKNNEEISNENKNRLRNELVHGFKGLSLHRFGYLDDLDSYIKNIGDDHD